MELVLRRKVFTKNSIQGSLYVNGKFECYTLEDTERPVKIKGETAIKAGKYKVILNVSNRFKKRMPLLLDVPEFEGIRIHSGNTKADTEGCILVGKTKGIDSVGTSRDAFKALMIKLKDALEDKEEITIEIVKEETKIVNEIKVNK